METFRLLCLTLIVLAASIVSGQNKGDFPFVGSITTTTNPRCDQELAMNTSNTILGRISPQ